MRNAAQWDALDVCGWTGNRAINTGNGYLGGLPFAPILGEPDRGLR